MFPLFPCSNWVLQIVKFISTSLRMNDYYEGISLALIVIIFIVTGFFSFTAGKKLFDLFSWLYRRIRKEQATVKETDIAEIKKTNLQIAHDWIEMMRFIKGMQDSQIDFVDRLQNHIETIKETLGRSITVSLEEEFLRNDQRYGKMRRTIEAIQGDILSVKIFLQTFHKKAFKLSENAEKEKQFKKGICIDNFAQTEREIKKRVTEGHTKIVNDTEKKLMNIVKKCLADLMKDTKLHLSIDQDEENRELQVVLSKLAEDKEEIKKTIIQAFLIAAEQAKRNFDHFGHIGYNAMNYVAVLNKNTNKMLKIKLKKTNNKLKGILSAINQQNFDFDIIKETLEKIDGQFDQILKRVDSHKNIEHCDELAESLEKTSNKWVLTAVELENALRNLSNDSKQIEEMLKEFKISFNCLKPAEKKEIIYCDSLTSQTTQDPRMLSQNEENMMLISSMIQSCWENKMHMNSRVEKGCENLCNQIKGLEHKLRSLNKFVDRLDQVMRSVNLENFFTGGKCQDANSDEIMKSVLRSSIGNAGDGQQQISENLRNTLVNDTPIQKVQLAMVKEVTIIEHILMKVCEKLKKGVPDNSMLAANITEGSQISSTIAYDEHDSGYFKKLEQDGLKNAFTDEMKLDS